MHISLVKTFVIFVSITLLMVEGKSINQVQLVIFFMKILLFKQPSLVTLGNVCNVAAYIFKYLNFFNAGTEQ